MPVSPPGRGFLIEKEVVKIYQKFNCNSSKKPMKITEYIKDTRAEMTHVTWPTRKQAIAYSILVVVISVGISLYLGLADYVFSRLLTLLF